MASSKRRGPRYRANGELTAGFSISTYGEDIIESNLEDLLSRYPEAAEELKRRRYLGKRGAITKRGWDRLFMDSARLERNALRWLRRTFTSARDEGHSGEELVGTLWYDADDAGQMELLELGQEERIDMIDSSYGDFAEEAFEGVSDFGQSLLGGQINFFDVELPD